MPEIQKELIKRRTANSKTFDLGKGRRQLVVSIGDVHYKDNYADLSEQWKDIELTFVDGKITKAPYILDVNELSITLTSKKTGTVQTLALERIGSEKSKRPIPWEFAKNQAIWKNAAPNTDVIIEAGGNLVRFKRILHSANASLEAEFTHSKVVGKADDILLHTSARDADGELLEVVKTDVDGNLTESIDSRIDLSKVKFPIEIDPILTVQPEAKATYLNESAPDFNYSGLFRIHIKDFSNDTRRLSLEFDISALPAGGILINSANLELYYQFFLSSDPVGKTTWAYKLTRTDWVELEATWNDYKTDIPWTSAGGDYVTSTPAGGSAIVPASYNWMAWNVLAIVQDAFDNTNPVELLVRFETEDLPSEISTAYFYTRYYLTDPDLQPKLVIDYTPVAPTVTTQAVTDIGFD